MASRKDIHKDGVKTQFQKGHKGSVDHKVKPWGYRKELKYLAAQELDIDPNLPPEEVLKLLDKHLRKLAHPPKKSGRNTIARLVAVRMLERVIKKMDPNLVDKLIDQTEGKQIQPNFNADYSRLDGMSEEELDDELKRIEKEIVGLQDSLARSEAEEADGEETA